MNEKFGVQIAGTGSYLPDKILTNFDLEKMVDTSDQWILERTGIRERRIASENTVTSDIAVEAAKKAIADAKIQPADIDLIIVATTLPDMNFPSTACIVQKKLNIRKAACFDLSAACCGFIYGLGIVKSLIETGSFKTCLLVGAELLSKITNWKDRGSCVLFGDGAGAAILTRSDKNKILSVYMGSDGRYSEILEMPAGGSRMPASEKTVRENLHTIKMEGKEVFKLAILKMLDASRKALETSGKKIEDLALLIPHQANLRIIEAMAERLTIPRERVFVNLDKYGNISSATTIIALDEARKQGKLKSGDLVELIAFGAGLTWGAAILEM